jgi:hypothetical protein
MNDTKKFDYTSICKPCPFCGSEVDIPPGRAPGYLEDDLEIAVVCSECFCAGPHAVSTMTAVLLWNMRGVK